MGSSIDTRVQNGDMTVGDGLLRLTWRPGVLSGVVDGLPVEVRADVDDEPARAAGTVAGGNFNVEWQSDDNYMLPPGQPLGANVVGTWDGGEARLNGSFRLRGFRDDEGTGMPREIRERLTSFFDEGSIDGTVLGDAVRATAKRIRASTTSTVLVDGTWGTTRFAVIGVVGSDRSTYSNEGRVRGRVGDHLVRISTKTNRASIALEGSFSGPPPLALIIAFCLLYFTGGLFNVEEGGTSGHETEAAASLRERLFGEVITVERVGGTWTPRDPLPKPPARLPLVRLRLVDGFEVLDYDENEVADPGMSFAVSEPVFDAAHRVARDLRQTTDLNWTLVIDLSQPGETEASISPGRGGALGAEETNRRLIDSGDTGSVMELARFAQPIVSGSVGFWPSCPGHSHAAAAAIIDGTPAWSCPADQSVIAPIGRLRPQSSSSDPS
jgi:hypothetical protein